MMTKNLLTLGMNNKIDDRLSVSLGFPSFYVTFVTQQINTVNGNLALLSPSLILSLSGGDENKVNQLTRILHIQSQSNCR